MLASDVLPRAPFLAAPLPSEKGTLHRFEVVSPEIQDQILLLTVLYASNSISTVSRHTIRFAGFARLDFRTLCDHNCTT